MRLILIIPVLAFLSLISPKFDPGEASLLNSFQNEFLARINNVRKSGCKCGKVNMPPVEPLSWNTYLERSASAHAQDMNKSRYFDHTSLSGKTIKNRLEEAGYSLKGLRSYAFGENIATGQRSIDQVMKSWLKSEGHCKNIMNKNFKEVGVAEINHYWVQDFGMRVTRN